MKLRTIPQQNNCVAASYPHIKDGCTEIGGMVWITVMKGFYGWKLFVAYFGRGFAVIGCSEQEHYHEYKTPEKPF